MEDEAHCNNWGTSGSDTVTIPSENYKVIPTVEVLGANGETTGTLVRRAISKVWVVHRSQPVVDPGRGSMPAEIRKYSLHDSMILKLMASVEDGEA